jgi:Cu+-exporting ATPase
MLTTFILIAVWSLQFAIAVFVVPCPCGIGLAAPTALLVGCGIAAKFGILARGGGEALQEMAQVDLVVFDKTGTLTEGGEPRVSNVIMSQAVKMSVDVVLGIAAEMESSSSHPLGIAIRKYCEHHGGKAAVGSQMKETPGKGLKGHFDGLNCTAIIGNEVWMEEHGVSIDGILTKKMDSWRSAAKSVVLLAIRDDSQLGENRIFQIAAVFSISDRLRSEAKGVVSYLQKNTIGTWMISGDNVATAQAVARSIGIPATNVIADVLPHEKVASSSMSFETDFFSRLKKSGGSKGSV